MESHTPMGKETMRNNNKIEQSSTFRKRPLASWVRTFALATGAVGPLISGAVFAQEGEEVAEEVVVTGTRQLIQDQIAIKRDNTAIVDGLSATDIGELPALSIGEALESITGAASHRENGGATEISIRGLGPFLSATTFNGRVATNGSGDRSVNFSQFPSELLNKLSIFKTQSADQIEGGVAGVISLETLRPLDYGKRRLQIDGKLNVNPDQLNVDSDLQGDIGTRFTVSYVDQFEFDNGMALGWSVGGQSSSISQPEAEYRSSSPSGTSLFACINDPTNTEEGFFRSTNGDCEDTISGSGQGFDTTIDPDTGLAVDAGSPFAFTGSTRSYRQNETSDERDSFFAAIQFQPNEQWDINFDVELSDREQREERHDLSFSQRRVTTGVTGENLVLNSDGSSIAEWRGLSTVEALSEKFQRTEEYRGGGLAVTFLPNDRLTLDVDIAYSKTTRDELQIGTRVRGGDSSNSIDTFWSIPDEIPQFTVENFDVTDINNFVENTNLRIRLDNENVRENVVSSLRFDGEYLLDNDFITSVKGGFRSAKLTYLRYGGNQGNGSRTEYDLDDLQDDVDGPQLSDLEVADLVSRCEIAFPETDFLESVSSGALITNVDDIDGANGGNVISTSSSYVSFDAQCLADAVTGALGTTTSFPSVVEESSGTIDVTETTHAIYALANYESEFMGRSLRGNFGVRVVETQVDSVGYRSTFSVDDSDPTDLELIEDEESLVRIEENASYTEVLPSASFVWDYADNLIIRGGVFRGLSRTDPDDLGFQRSFSTDDDNDTDDTEATTIEELVVGANGTGNPSAEPFTSWNTDLSFEYYPNDDAIFSVGIYHKRFTGGTETQVLAEDFVIEGQTLSLPISTSVTTDDTSNLYGIEVTASYRWDSGIGVKLSYNHAESDFEMEDSLYGDTFTTDFETGDVVQLTDGIVDPGNIAGFSEDVFSGQLYYQIGDFDVAAIYKYRSEYFQPFTSDGSRLRYVDDVGVWEARASYKVTDNVKVKLEAINLFSEPKTQYYFTNTNLGEVNDYGPRIFVGVSAKFF